MFDDLRNDLNANPYEEQPAAEAQFQPAAGTRATSSAPRPKKILGMTSQQRFILAVMLFFAVCAIGAMCLLVTGKVGF